MENSSRSCGIHVAMLSGQCVMGVSMNSSVRRPSGRESPVLTILNFHAEVS